MRDAADLSRKSDVLQRSNVCTFQHVAHVEDGARYRHSGGDGDIKPHEIVAPLAEIVFAPHPEFGTFQDVHYPVADPLKREHVSRAINMLRGRKCC